LNLFSSSFSAEELLGVTAVELVKKEGSSLGIVISGKYGIWQLSYELRALISALGICEYHHLLGHA